MDLNRLKSVKELAAEVAAWQERGRPEALLIDDVERANELLALVRQLESNTPSPVSETTRVFVTRSIALARRRRNRRRRRLTYGFVGVIVAAAVGIPAALRLGNVVQTNGQSFVTSGQQILTKLPEWTGLLSGALLLQGTPAQQTLARQTLLSALTEPWGLGPVNGGPGYVTQDLYQIPDTKKLGVVLGTGRNEEVTELATFTIQTGQFSHVRRIPGTYYFADTADGDTQLALAGPSGAKLMERNSGKVEAAETKTPVRGARLSSNEVLSYVTGQGSVDDLAAGQVGPRSVGTYKDVLDIERVRAGDVEVLAMTTPGDYTLVDATDDTIIATAKLPAPNIAAGGISDDGATAYVSGADNQLWALSAGARPQPTGVPTTDRDVAVHGLPGDRVVVGGYAEPAEVYYVPDALLLGQICTNDPDLTSLVSFPGSDVVACEGSRAMTLWDAPAGPVGTSAASVARGLHGVQRSDNGTALFVQGDSIKVRLRRYHHTVWTTGWVQPFESPITASAVAADGTQVMFGSSTGQILIADVATTGLHPVGVWTIPGNASPTGADPGTRATVTDASGNVWRVPDCAGCDTEAGLLRALKGKLSGCWLSHQLMSINATMRRRFGIDLCKPLAGPAGS
jgi:hypothetical protein